LKSYVLSA